MKAFTSLLKKRAQAENTSSAPNGWTTQSVRSPCGCSSKLPGDGNLCKSAADCARVKPQVDDRQNYAD